MPPHMSRSPLRWHFHAWIGETSVLSLQGANGRVRRMNVPTDEVNPGPLDNFPQHKARTSTGEES
jgi:hypothetical protein